MRLRLPLVVLSFTSLAGLALAYCTDVFFAATASVTASVALPACDTGDAGGLPIITGIEIRSDTLTAGHGCGTAPDQVFKYGVVVDEYPTTGGVTSAVYAGQQYLALNFYDCFADAVFSNLCTYDGGTGGTDSTYAVRVYAFNAAAWSAITGTDGGGAGPAGSSSQLPNQTLCTPALEPDLDIFRQATWTTTCTATQQAEISVLAQCGPLTAGPPASN